MFFLRKTASLLLLLVTTTSCSYSHLNSKNLTPQKIPDPISFSKPVRVALVLGSGGTRGMAHLGVLEELEEEGIPIDLIVGCSIGSFIGALYADCPNVDSLKSVLEKTRTRHLVNFNPFTNRGGLWRDKSMRRFLNQKLNSNTFDQLQIPLVVMTTDLLTGEATPIAGGEIIPSICASCAVPFFFKPVMLYGRLLVDGGVVNPVPIDIAKERNPTVIIAVDLGGLLPEKIPKNIFHVTERTLSIMNRNHNAKASQEADIVIRPEIDGSPNFFSNKSSLKYYEAGRRAARDAMPEIKRLLD